MADGYRYNIGAHNNCVYHWVYLVPSTLCDHITLREKLLHLALTLLVYIIPSELRSNKIAISSLQAVYCSRNSVMNNVRPIQGINKQGYNVENPDLTNHFLLYSRNKAASKEGK